MNFAESVKYLYSLGNEVLAMKLGLENPTKLFQALGNPQNNYQKVQVAGTNGKGSTCAFLDSICRQANIKTGLYTSPHLVSITERIKINGEEISENDFAKYATKVRKITESEQLYATFFEQMTAIALLAFAENNIELAILETGLGGRLDATTAANAEIVAITPIDLDHQQYLGETIEEIAGEKAGIIRSENQKVVISKQLPEAEKVILERCENFGIEPIRNCNWVEENSNEYFLITQQRFNKPKVYLGDLSLKGKHQFDNACVAVDLAETLAIKFGFKIGVEEIDNGLQNATHTGRLEFYKGILLDGAHNVAGAKALREYLQKYYENAQITLIFGAMKDKNISEIAAILFPLAKDIILTQPNNARAINAEELKEIASKILNENKVFVVRDVADAIDSARQINAEYSRIKPSLICLTGSLYLVGEVQKILSESYD